VCLCAVVILCVAVIG